MLQEEAKNVSMNKCIHVGSEKAQIWTNEKLFPTWRQLTRLEEMTATSNVKTTSQNYKEHVESKKYEINKI